MIETSVITWLSGVSGISGRVYTGTRMQSTALPSLVVEVAAGEPLCIGATPRLTRFPVTVRAVAETMAQAQTIAALVGPAMVSGAAGAAGCSVEVQRHALQEPVLGEGDEAAPAICDTQFEVYLDA